MRRRDGIRYAQILPAVVEGVCGSNVVVVGNIIKQGGIEKLKTHACGVLCGRCDNLIGFAAVKQQIKINVGNALGIRLCVGRRGVVAGSKRPPTGKISLAQFVEKGRCRNRHVKGGRLAAVADGDCAGLNFKRSAQRVVCDSPARVVVIVCGDRQHGLQHIQAVGVVDDCLPLIKHSGDRYQISWRI